ncbi:MAG: diguanylate cyclase [Thermoleophilaceae bacterium]|nr:diguanylate cyclase [Thermoleophilaceae bacterium]
MEPARGIVAAPSYGQAGSEREALLRVAAAAAGAHNLEEVLEVAAEEARAAIGAASLSVSRWERDEDVLRTVINVGELGPGEDRYPIAEIHPLREDRTAERLVVEGLAYFHAVDAVEIDEVSARRLIRLGKESEVGVPILVEGEAWGEVYATTAPGQPRFRGEDVRFLETVAGQLAVAIGRAELFSRVSRLAYEDPLTGLANRRALEERLQRAVARATDRNATLAVLLCDVDELKAINDAAGHDAGDRALQRVGEALVAAAAARAGNLVGRLSGDEFCVVMEGASLEDARVLAAATLANLDEADGHRILISCGAAALGHGVDTLAELMRAADAALYRAKRNGGGQIFTAGSRASDVTQHPERRTLRRTTQERVRDAVQDLSARFADDLAAEGPLERIEAVAVALSEALNTAAWAISFAPEGSHTIHTVATADGRDKRLEGLRLGLDNDVYSVEEYPATARLLLAGAGAFVARVDDQAADRAERTLLELLGRTSVLAATAADQDLTWLLELYSDDRTAPLEEGRVEAALLLRSAIPPRSARKGAALRDRWRRQTDLTSALGSGLARETREGAMVEASVNVVHEAMGAQATAIFRLRDGGRMALCAGAGAFARPEMRGYTQAIERGLVGRCLRQGGVVLAADVTLEPDHATTEATADIRSELDVPLVVDARPWGVISLQSTERDAFDDGDASMLRAAAHQLSAGLRSAMLHSRLERAQLGTAEALKAALDARAAATAESPASLVQRCEAVGRRLEMGEDGVTALRYAATLHDIGELGVPEAILNKPGPLTAEERPAVERTPLIGEGILSPVEFLADALPLVRAAHERWDGAGYPDGLAGEQIPLGARILLACDAYDAMTAKRPYRSALRPQQAEAELRRVAGMQLDPGVVEALLEVLHADS